MICRPLFLNTTFFLHRMYNSNTELFNKELRSILAVSFYTLVSIGLIFLNHFILTNEKVKTDPLFMSWFQFIVAYFLIIIITTLCSKIPLLNLFPQIHYNFFIALKVLPVSLTYLLMIGLNNKCLASLSVSSYQIVRSLSIFFNIAQTYFILKKKTSFRCCLACLGVVFGFLLGINGDVNLSIRGAIIGVISSFFSSLYSIVVKKIMSLLENNEYLLLEYNTPISIILLSPILYYNKEFEIFSTDMPLKFWIIQISAGILGFILNISVFLNIKYTTPLTHNICGTVKSCLQTMLAFIVFPGTEKMTVKKFFGTLLVIGFSTYYAFIRRSEMAESLEQNKKENDLAFLLNDTGTEIIGIEERKL